MARPRRFEPDAVLDAARDLFWARGYEGTSLDDITRATGVNKPSLFAAFGDKSELFHMVLDRYHAMLLAHARLTLRADVPARDAVRAWLMGFVPACSGAKGRRGCLSANAAVAPPTEGAADRVASYNRAVEALLRQVLERGRKDGEFDAAFDARATARALLAMQLGLMNLARQQPSAGETKAAVERILALLD